MYGLVLVWHIAHTYFFDGLNTSSRLLNAETGTSQAYDS